MAASSREGSEAAIETPAPFETDPWTIARDRYLSSLTPEERLLFHEDTIENLYYGASVMNSSDRKSSRIRKAIEAVQPLIERIEDYGKAMDVYADMSTMTLSPIWGSIRVVLVLARTIGRLFEKIAECLGRIGDILPQLLDYQRIFSPLKHPRLRESLAKMYLDIIAVCIEFKAMIKEQQNNPLKRLIPSSSIEQRLKEAEAKFRIHRKAVEKEVETCHMLEAGEARALAVRDQQLQEANNRVERKRTLLNHLSALNRQAKHKKVQNFRHEETGSWLFGAPEFQSWNEPKQSSAILCCYGIPGCGKTVLVSSVVDYFMAVSLPSQTPVAYNYCDHADKRTLTPIVILGALARALLEGIEIPAALAETIATTYGDGERTPDTNDVLQILTSAIKRFESVVIIIDGIDEVADEDRTEVCRSLKVLMTEVQVPVKLFISCREDILPSVCAQDATSFRVQISETRISTDIEGYISHSVSSLIGNGDLVIRNPSLQQIIVNTLVEGAKGMFLWVKFQLNELCIAETDDAIITTLQDLPKDLSETYDRLLGRILVELKEGNAGSW